MSAVCPDHFVCPVRHTDEPMEDPVVAADGHTYEREAIAEWLERSKTSPVTREKLQSTRLTPNHHLKSQIAQWREEQRGDVPRQRRLEELLNQVMWSTASPEAAVALSALRDFVAETQTLIPPAQLKRLGRMLRGDEELWSDAVEGAYEEVEHQRQALLRSLRSKLLEARRLRDAAVKASAREEAELARLEVELARLEAKLTVKQRRARELAEDSTLRRDCQREVEKWEREIGDAPEEEEEEEPKGDTGAEKKRKKQSEGDDAPKRAKTDVDGGMFCSAMRQMKCDFLKGEVMIEAAADAGDACAKAYCLFRGWGGRKKDQKEASQRFRQLEEKGRLPSVAMRELGDCYRDGRGVAKDEAKAVEWYTKAAEAGHTAAMITLGECYGSGWGVAHDRAKAVEWHTKAAEAGNADAMHYLGLRYRYGWGVAKDEAKAVEWDTKAAEAGNADAMRSLGRCYRDGKGVAKDEAQATEWFNKARFRLLTDDSDDDSDDDDMPLCLRRF